MFPKPIFFVEFEDGEILVMPFGYWILTWPALQILVEEVMPDPISE